MNDRDEMEPCLDTILPAVETRLALLGVGLATVVPVLAIVLAVEAGLIMSGGGAGPGPDLGRGLEMVGLPFSFSCSSATDGILPTLLLLRKEK